MRGTYRHVLAPVSRKGLFVLEQDAVAWLPAWVVGRGVADAAVCLCKRKKEKKGQAKELLCTAWVWARARKTQVWLGGS